MTALTSALTSAPAARNSSAPLTVAGRAVRLRPVSAADAVAMNEFVRGLSAEARRLRFHAPINGCSPALLRLLTDVDSARGIALVAVQSLDDGDRIVGEARYTIDAGGGRAEFAIAVADGWQGCGLAQQLMQALLTQARAAGLQGLYGSVLDGNARMQRFMQKLGFTAACDEDAEPGITRWEQPLQRDVGDVLVSAVMRGLARLAQVRPALSVVGKSLVGTSAVGKSSIGQFSSPALSR